MKKLFFAVAVMMLLGCNRYVTRQYAREAIVHNYLVGRESGWVDGFSDGIECHEYDWSEKCFSFKEWEENVFNLKLVKKLCENFNLHPCKDAEYIEKKIHEDRVKR